MWCVEQPGDAPLFVRDQLLFKKAYWCCDFGFLDFSEPPVTPDSPLEKGGHDELGNKKPQKTRFQTCASNLWKFGDNPATLSRRYLKDKKIHQIFRGSQWSLSINLSPPKIEPRHVNRERDDLCSQMQVINITLGSLGLESTLHVNEQMKSNTCWFAQQNMLDSNVLWFQLSSDKCTTGG